MNEQPFGSRRPLIVFGIPVAAVVLWFMIAYVFPALVAPWVPLFLTGPITTVWAVVVAIWCRPRGPHRWRLIAIESGILVVGGMVVTFFVAAVLASAVIR